MYACNIRTLICQCTRVNQNIFQTVPYVRAAHGKSNHYETLKLKPNCTAKDIRDSFLKLSKENHPDVSTAENTKRNAEKFRDIVEAYQVLGKTESRAVYDSVINQDGGGPFKFVYYDPSQPYQNSGANNDYYGVFGSKRISNGKIVMYCLIFMVVGVIVQAFAIRYSITFRRDKLDRVSMEAGKVHSQVRAHAEEYGNEYQLQKLAEKSTRGTN